MQLSPQEAAAALAEIEDARARMRHVIRSHRGHAYLWIWGVAWVIMPLLVFFRGEAASRLFGWICLVAGVASAVVGFTQHRQIRVPINTRLFGAIATLLGFAAIFPFVLGVRPDLKAIYAFICLVAMQVYVVAGIWTDCYLLWLGLAVTALILIGFFLLPGIFWLWMAIFAGGSLIATGFYVRYRWH